MSSSSTSPNPASLEHLNQKSMIEKAAKQKEFRNEQNTIVTVKKSTMNEEMEQYAMKVAFRALTEFSLEKDAAKYIKQVY
jgi:hypothetical protein